MALALAEAGADIIKCRSSLAASTKPSSRYRLWGRRFHAYQADFSQRPAVDAFDGGTQDFPRIDMF
jgi:2-deoxy-D-gluconate 3-dehydrogenase